MAMTDFTRDEVIKIVHILEKADLTGINLPGANLRRAKYNKYTRFPEGFDPEAAGMEFVEG
jgi:hypothetical protein